MGAVCECFASKDSTSNVPEKKGGQKEIKNNTTNANPK